ncbi:kinase-like domain-containing protein [Dactylonectria macrodidyma]|uniref:Kinase-like domain-containing protein n=1 Tax=Dactylonectria macrodidyma TaxID=307937 RepID=A0A9P9JNQ8_9HYPO|nr:kinase-like domain-containing protein [Dactylonectria macrodidyma]
MSSSIDLAARSFKEQLLVLWQNILFFTNSQFFTPHAPKATSKRSTIPYYAPKETWPVPTLPTLDEISQGEHLEDSWSNVCAVKVGEHFVAKFGRRVDFLEGDNTMFVKKNTNIPVPTIYAMYQADLEVQGEMMNCSVIVMEYIKGKTVRSSFNDLNDEEKERFALQLRSHLSELRALPSEGYFGAIGEGPLNVPFHGYYDNRRTLQGPHRTEEEFVNAMAAAMRHTHYSRDWAEFCIPHIRKAFRGHEPVFTHAHLSHENILIRDEDKSPVLIDWEYSAWLPSFWEHAYLVKGSISDDGWLPYASKALDAETETRAWMEMVSRCW